MSSSAEPNADMSFSKKWTRALQRITKPMLQPVIWLADHAARNPKLHIISIILFSIGILVLGLATNFNQETDDDIWTPQNSRTLSHGKWVSDDSNFPSEARPSIIIVHRDGESLFGDGGELAAESMERLFEALEEFRNTPRYDELCQFSDYIDPYTEQNTCQVVGATAFWKDDAELFQQQALSDAAVLEVMTQPKYPFGGVVDHNQIIGFNEFSSESGILEAGKSYVMVLLLPPDESQDGTSTGAFSEDFEEKVLDRMLELQDQWNADNSHDFRLEIIAERSFEDEFSRAVSSDLPLLPLVFVLMSILCIIIFAKRDPVQSRSWMGFGAVITVLLAIMSSFGLLFVIGVPFTALTPLLPFIMFGVGLDNAFIISGAFARTDPNKTPEKRIRDTMEDIGGTILLTTLTSTLAFALGAVSAIPAVKYLVTYAFPTIMIDFLYQITFFVAVIVIDQRRVDENRRDCCFCCTKKDNENDQPAVDEPRRDEQHFADRLMASYADFLLKPTVRATVIAVFAAMLGFFSWRTSKLHQYFDFTDVIPGDSYIQPWWDSYQDLYEANGVRAEVYFRDVDFSDEDIQMQMEAYVVELAGMPYAGEDEPFDFWLRDFKTFIANSTLDDLTFDEQIQLFLEDPIYYDSYKDEIVFEDGVMTASRTLIRLDNVDEVDVLQTIDVLDLQSSISADQPANKGKNEWSFFMFTSDFYIWEFYRVCPDELRLTTIVGTISVSFLALILIPHLSAILFVGPLVAILYIDLLGFVEMLGVHVNPVMYISTVMSIGLMVDFVMHVTLRYVETTGETRELKTKETLETIGASVLVGGISTLVGVMPLALSTSEIFWTTFIIFFGLVLLGLLHGLVLLPVLLSMFGPLESISQLNSDTEAKGIQQTARPDSDGSDSA